MAGNEVNVVKYLISNIGKIKLKHLGTVNSICVPAKNGTQLKVCSLEELIKFSTEDSSKKADIYINECGVSIKQAGGSFGFNRIQRAELEELLVRAGIKSPKKIAERFDELIRKFHGDAEMVRNQRWNLVMTEGEFKLLMHYLLTIGSPNHGDSKHPVKYILEAPAKNISADNILVYTFDEYFETHKDSFVIALRRVWYGQSSDNEHGRAVGLLKKEGNANWIFDSVSGSPRKSRTTQLVWRPEIDPKDRKTIYLVFIEKE